MEPLNIELDLRHPNVDMGFRNALRHLCTLKTRAISLTFIVPPLLPLNIEFELLHSVVRRRTSRNLIQLWSQIIALSWSPNGQELCLWELYLLWTTTNRLMGHLPF